MSAGADCGTIVSGKRTQLTFEQFIHFLEPEITPGIQRAGAICQSSKDFFKMMTALEQLCIKLDGRCTVEVEDEISELSSGIEKHIHGYRGEEIDVD